MPFTLKRTVTDYKDQGVEVRLNHGVLSLCRDTFLGLQFVSPPIKSYLTLFDLTLWSLRPTVKVIVS